MAVTSLVSHSDIQPNFSLHWCGFRNHKDIASRMERLDRGGGRYTTMRSMRGRASKVKKEKVQKLLIVFHGLQNDGLEVDRIGTIDTMDM